VEQKFKLQSDDEEIHLLSEKSIKEHLSKKIQLHAYRKCSNRIKASYKGLP
jgi:hypothetical protein